ncbi:hypothetical protein V8F33_012131 [Rhypophila sp. PSN 637]
MHFLKIFTQLIAVATIATAAPSSNLASLAEAAGSAIEKRGGTLPLCAWACAGECAVNPLVCLACVAICVGAAVPGEPIDLDGLSAKTNDLVAVLERDDQFAGVVAAVAAKE